MSEKKENIFVVGPQAAGESFIGRKEEVRDLETAIFESSAAVHLVGPTRTGKSSLVARVFALNREKPQRICLQVNMGECESALDFWFTLANTLRSEVEDKGLWNPAFAGSYKMIDSLQMLALQGNSNWFVAYKTPLKNILRQIGKAGWRVVLAVDEFDNVVRIFGEKAYYFQLLRSVFNESDLATSGVVISRRRLHLLEASNPDISTFHGVFREMVLKAFSEQDMEEYYEKLAQYNITLSSGGKKKLYQLTGNLPYLCCMLAERMVFHYTDAGSLGDKEVLELFRECRPQIDKHYDNLADQIEYDGQTEMVCYLAATSKLPASVSSREVENLIALGMLIPSEQEGMVRYDVYCRDFTLYYSLLPLNLPTWETLMQSEKKLKAILEREYPELSRLTYRDLIAPNGALAVEQLNGKWPELRLDYDKLRRFANTMAQRVENPTVLQVMTMTDVVSVIKKRWDACFYRYFPDSSWRSRLELIKSVRQPVAHGGIEYIAEAEMAECLRYCEAIIKLEI